MPFTLIASLTLTSDTGSIGFSNIPGTYTDLYMKVAGKTNIGGDVDGVRFWINGTDVLSTSGAQRQNIFGSGASAERNNYNGIAIPGSGQDLANIWGDFEAYFPNYTNGSNKIYYADSTTEKNANTFVFQSQNVVVSSITAAITSLSVAGFDSGGSAWKAGTTAHLYGIKNS